MGSHPQSLNVLVFDSALSTVKERLKRYFGNWKSNEI